MTSRSPSSRSSAISGPRRTLYRVLAVGGLVGALGILASLGTWQAGRFLERRVSFALMEERQQLDRIDLTSATALTDELDYRHITLVGGELLMPQTVLVERRFHKHLAGDWTVTPYRFADGSAVLVHTGWIPEGRPELASQPPQSLAGFVVTANRLKQDAQLRANPDFSLAGLPRLGELDLPALYAALDLPGPPRDHTFVVLNGPEQPLVYPVPSHAHITKPYLTPGVHFGYATMWYGSALLLIWLFWAGWTGKLDPRAR